ncbi:universal stress protein [Tenacibaculum xiamenense]|uniref:universal stress protein n=1 Tax=Tenacibaculum xiamenense TaxID=1261553 RepID=UPI0038947E4E
MKKILIPIDFSKHSEYACVLASKIAKKAKSEIHLVHMVELPSGIVDMGAGSNFSIPESMLYLKKVKDKLVDIKAKYFDEFEDIQHSIRFQNPFEGIRDYSQKIKPDLIVMGSKGQTALKEMIIGSNTEKTIASMNIPVLITKKNDAKFKFKKMVFASTFEKDEAKAFEGFLEFTRFFNSKLYLLKVNTPKNFEDSIDSKNKVEKFIKKYDIEKYSIHVYNSKSVPRGILNFSTDKEVDLISIATHGRTGLSKYLNGSISMSLSKNVVKPVLTFKV